MSRNSFVGSLVASLLSVACSEPTTFRGAGSSGAASSNGGASSSTGSSLAPPVVIPSRPTRSEAVLAMRRAATRSQRGELALAGLTDLGLLPRELTSGLAAVTGSRVPPESCGTGIAVTLSQHARPVVERRCGVFEELSVDLSLTTGVELSDALQRRCTRPSSSQPGPLPLETGAHPWALVASLVAEDLIVAAGGDDDARELAGGLTDLCRLADRR